MHAFLGLFTSTPHRPFGLTSTAVAGLITCCPALGQNTATTLQGSARQPVPGSLKEQGPSKSGEVVVTGTRSPITTSPDRLSFDVAGDLQVQTGTVADALKAVPGVDVDLQGRVSLRGDPSVEIWIDGRPSALLRGDSRGDVLLSMPAGQVQRVEVITNPSAASSPEGSGGIINLVSKQARKNSQYATVRGSLGFPRSLGLSVSGAHSSGDLTLTGDAAIRRTKNEFNAVQVRSRVDSVTGDPVASRQESELENIGRFGNGRLGIDFDVDKNDRLSAELGYGQSSNEVERVDDFTSTRLASSYERSSEMIFSQRGINGRMSWRRTLPGREHEFVADLTVAKSQADRNGEGITTSATNSQPIYDLVEGDIDRSDLGVKLDYKKPVGRAGLLNVGYQGVSSRNDYDSFIARGSTLGALLPDPGLTNRFAYDQTIHAAFATYRFELGKLSAQGGIRFEQVDNAIDQITDGIEFEDGYFRAYPTLNLTYGLGKTQQLRASVSRRIQRPTAQDLNPYLIYIDPQNLRQGNPLLRPEVSDSIEFGWTRRQGATFHSLTGFYRHAEGGITDILRDVGKGVFLTSRANLAVSRRAGIETIANGRFNKVLSYNVSGTLFWTEIDLRTNGTRSPRSGISGTARGNLDFQPTAKDYFQLNGSYTGKQILPQGHRLSSGSLNAGYRRKVNDRLSLLFTSQNILKSIRQSNRFSTALLDERYALKGFPRTYMVGLSYNIGGTTKGKRQEPGFEYQEGGPVAQ